MLPTRPSFSTADPRAFSAWPPLTVCSVRFILSCTSTPPQRLCLAVAAFLPVSIVDNSHLRKAPRSSFSTLQHLRIQAPFFSTSDSEGVWITLPCHPEVPSPGFGYPLDGVSCLEPLKASFSSQRSWASLFRAFLLSSDQIDVSINPLRSCTFLPNLPAWYRCSSGLLPPEKPCPSRASRRISSGRGRVLS